MKVLLLGAGASKPAGYPLARELIDTIGAEAAASPFFQYREAWGAWQSYREDTKDLLRSLLFSPNPEVVLSIPDLFEVAVASQDRAEFDLFRSRFEEDPNASPADYEAYLDSPTREALRAAVVARSRFLLCLDWFFRFRHAQDASQRARLDYLRTLVHDLGLGDIVITLNWDTALERTLCEEGLRNPVNGYGFQKVLVHRSSDYDEPQTLPEDFPQSPIEVLKLHGSFGWVQHGPNLVFEHARYLSLLGFKWDGAALRLRDPVETSLMGTSPSALLYPSFLKQIKINIPDLQRIWSRAAAAVERATQLDVWGYSLPESDGPVRALLAGLRDRSEAGSLRLVVHDPCPEVLHRWESFVGPSAAFERHSLTAT